MSFRAFRGLLLLLLAFFLAAELARADLVIVQKVEGSGQSGEQTIRIKGDKARTDLAQHVSMITDGATGDIVTLQHAQRTYLKIPAAQTRAMMEQMQKQVPPGSEAPRLKSTGKTEKVGAFDCEIYTTSFGGMTVTYWIAKSFPNFAAILAQMEKLQGASISAMGKGLMPELKDFPGMQLKTEMNLGGQKVTTVILSVKDEAVDPASFVVPPDYQETAAPLLKLGPK